MFHIQSFLPLIAGIAYIPLLIIAAANRPWRKHHTLFLLFLVSGMFWSICVSLLRSDYFVAQKPLLFQINSAVFIWMVIQFYSFVRFYVYKNVGWGTYLGYAALITVIVGSILNYLPESLIYDHGKLTPVLGFWVIPIVFIPVILAAVLIYSLVQKYESSSDPAQRNRIVYLVITVALLCIFSVINSTRAGDTLPFGQIGQLLNAAILTYATLKFRILDMNTVIRNGLIHTTLIVACLVIFAFWFSIIVILLKLELNLITSLASALLTAISAAFFWLKARDFLYHRINAMLYGETYDFRQELYDFIQKEIRGVFSLKELSQKLLPPLVKVLNCQRATMLFPETASGDFTADFIEPAFDSPESSLTVKRNSPVVTWLQRENSYLNRETMTVFPEFKGLWSTEIEQFKNLAVELLFPIISRGNLIGILALSQKSLGKFTLDEVNFVESIVSQVAISLEKEYLQEELRKREQELSVINRLALVITSSLNIQEVYDNFIDILRGVISVDLSIITQVEDNHLCFSAVSSSVSSPWKVGDKIRIKGTATEWLSIHKKSLMESNLDRDCIFYTSKEYYKRGIRSIIYIPLITKDEVMGSLIVGSCQVEAYNLSQVNLLERLASHISTAVVNSFLYTKAEQRSRIDELTGLYNRRHFDETLDHEIDRHSRYGSTVSLALIDLDNFKRYNDTLGHIAGDKLIAKVGHILQSAVRNIDIAFRYGGDEFAIIMPHTSAENSLTVTERFRNKIFSETASKMTPVTASIGLASWPNDGLTVEHLLNAADRALYHAKQTGGNRNCLVSQMLPMSTNIQTGITTSEKETLNIIYALASTIEARDTYTFGHSQKVRAYAVALGEALNLPPEKVVAISHAALLHDIGKIGIYDGILNKAGKLDKAEFELIKTHPDLSRTIVGHVASLTPCLQAIHQHHERWDGEGYPNKLKGEAISLEGRILAIADSFDAMTSKRPYRAPLSSKEAVQELKRCSGTQFDPKLVEVFIPIALSITPAEIAVKPIPIVPED